MEVIGPGTVAEIQRLKDEVAKTKKWGEEYYVKFFEEVRRREDVERALTASVKDRDRLFTLVEKLAEALARAK